MRYTCLDVRSPDLNFLRKVMSSSRHDGAAYRRHPWRQSANANIVFAFPLWLNHFPRKSHSLRRIYAGGAVLFCRKLSATAWVQVTGASFSVPFLRHSVNSLWVREACFVADTHAMESLRVWEAYSIADTQILKTGRYNNGTLYSQMPTVGVLYFGSI